MAKKLSMAARFWNCSVFELLDRNDPEMIEQGAAYAGAEKRAEGIADKLIEALK